MERDTSKMTTEKAGMVFFWEDKSPFSQFHPARFTADGKTFTHAEQYMMYSKAMLFGDEATAEQITAADVPKKMKALGRRVSPFDEKIWKANREEIVYKGSMAKFSQNEGLRKVLLDTGDKMLVEASPFDRIWGIGMGANAAGVENPKNWKGQNLLGKALRRARETIRNEEGKTN